MGCQKTVIFPLPTPLYSQDMFPDASHVKFGLFSFCPGSISTAGTGPSWMRGEELVSLVCWPAAFLLHTWYLVILQNATVPSSPFELASGWHMYGDHLPP